MLFAVGIIKNNTIMATAKMNPNKRKQAVNKAERRQKATKPIPNVNVGIGTRPNIGISAQPVIGIGTAPNIGMISQPNIGISSTYRAF